MKKLFLIAGLFSALVFTSCKKDKDKNNDGNNGTTRFVKKMTKTENGQTTVYNFTYDGNKRLTAFASANNNEYTNFSYDNNGNLIKVENVEDGFKNIYTYTYTNNVPVSGKFKSYELTAGEPDALIEDDELTYTVTNNQVSKIVLYMKEYDESLDMDLTYTNGNLSTVKSNALSAYTYEATFMFGNKKSPFPVISKYVLDQAGFSLLFSSKNELISSAYDLPGAQFDYSITQAYTYDSAGYPLTSDDGETKIVYEYQ